MKNENEISLKNPETPKTFPANDHTRPEDGSDHSGSDCDNDKTNTGGKSDDKSRFDKPKREVDPDTTEIDKDSDKTKK
jgi:hypothetical protein